MMQYFFRENADLMGFIGQLISNDYAVTITPERLGYRVEVDDGTVDAQRNIGNIRADRGNISEDS